MAQNPYGHVYGRTPPQSHQIPPHRHNPPPPYGQFHAQMQMYRAEAPNPYSGQFDIDSGFGQCSPPPVMAPTYQPPAGRDRGPRFQEHTQVNGNPRPGDPNRRFGDRQDSGVQEGSRRGGRGGREFKPFWKDKHLKDMEEQLEYLKHCKKWLRDEDRSNLIKKIREAPEPLDSLLNCQQLDSRVISLLLEVLTCENLMNPVQYEKQAALNIFARVIDSELIKSVYNINNYISDIYDTFEEPMQQDKRDRYFASLSNVFKLLNKLFLAQQSEVDVLWPLVRILFDKKNGRYVTPIPEEIVQEIDHLYEHCKNIRTRKTDNKKKKAQNIQFENDQETDYGCHYTQMEILPSKTEITNPDHTKLRHLLKNGRYPNADMYLDIHFKLLREDMIRPLRQGIQNFLKDEKENVRKELFMYEHVKIVEMDCDQKQGLLYRISFRVCNVRDPSKIRWDRVQRLKFGTLLCVLTYGADGKPSFEKPLWAVVAHRDEKELTEKRQISIKFKQGFQPNFEFNEDYFVVESRQVYYEAYFHTLSVIQNMTPETIPLKEIILGNSVACKYPSYINQNSIYQFVNIFPENPCIQVLGRWPPSSRFLDKSQFRAIKLILTKEVAIIQGPPGTGKTYVGAHALQVMLATRQTLIKSAPKVPQVIDEELNFKNFMNELIAKSIDIDLPLYRSLCQYPILIITYTNHALDQFLEYILSYEENIIRIGTRIDREELNSKTLPKVAKRIFDEKTNVPQQIRQLRYNTFDLQKELKGKQGVIKDLSKQLGSNTLTKEDFGKHLNEYQFNSLFDGNEDGFQPVNKNKKSIVDIWLDQHAPRHGSTQQAERGSSKDSNPQVSRKDKKKKNRNRGNPVHTSNKFDILLDGDSGEDELEMNAYEKQAEVLQDLKLLPTQRSPLRDSASPSPSPVQPQRITNPFDPNYFTQSPGGFNNFNNFSQQPLTNMALPPTTQQPARNLTNFNEFPPFNCTIQPPGDSRSHSPMSMLSTTTTDDFDILSLPSQSEQNTPFDLESEDNYLHHDSDDDDAVDAPFQDFYKELNAFGGMTLEQAKSLYYVDTTGASILPENILQQNNLWNLTHEQRRALYDYLLEQKKQEFNQILTAISTEYTNILKELQQKQRQLDVFVLRQAAIVGMTTTGAARNSELLAELHPRIIFVEEAAEVLEAHILACLSPHVEHLILIGDHQQLRPSNAVYELSKKYNLEISLFERLVNTEVEHVTLNIQHRMRPEISALIKPIYPDLTDFPDVHNYPAVKGVSRNIFFIDHKQWEDNLQEDSTSRTNKHEAMFVADFTRYLMKQGYDGKDITILTFYMGQKFKILDCLRKLGITGAHGVRCTTVDKYQGEENTIIIFSVVRSNIDNNIGYCRVDNRVCVALSRAKHGFYIIGNSHCLVNARSDTNLWKKVIETFKDNRGTSLPLSCQNHPQTITMVSKHSDFHSVRNGGCDLPCDKRLDCGHQCPQQCHPDGHDDVKCQKDCVRIHEPCKHPCVDKNGHRQKCYEPCDGCQYPVIKELEVCHHKQKLACSQKPEHELCKLPCQMMLPCNHPCPSRCGEDCLGSLCTQRIQVKLYCGHDHTICCYQSSNLLSVKCEAKCDHVLECGDPCPGTCSNCIQGKKHVPCERRCDNLLICGHPCQDRCHRPRICSPCRKKCINQCRHTRCGLPCGERCVSCVEECEWECRHFRCRKKCFEPCDRERCNYDCEERLECRHKCMGLCGELCPKVCKICNPQDENFELFFGNEDEEDARFLVLEDCLHIFEVSGFDQWMDVQKGGRENTGKIQLPFCPKCKIPIHKNLRYGNIVKQGLIDVEIVKEKIINEMRANLTKSCHELLNKIEISYPQLNPAQSEIVQDILRCVSVVFICDHRKLYIVFDLLNIFADLYEAPEQNWKSCHAHRAFLSSSSKIKKILDDKKFRPSDRYTMNDLETLSRRCVLSSLFASIDPIVTDVSDRIQFSSLRKRFMNSILQNPAQSLSLIHDCELFLANVTSKYRYQPLSQQERVQIALAVDVNRSGWYRCENGHIYGIGDCGGAVMEAKCNECGARIGGSGHRVQDNNTYAGIDMGGNTVPSWPGQPGFF